MQASLQAAECRLALLEAQLAHLPAGAAASDSAGGSPSVRGSAEQSPRGAEIEEAGAQSGPGAEDGGGSAGAEGGEGAGGVARHPSDDADNYASGGLPALAAGALLAAVLFMVQDLACR